MPRKRFEETLEAYSTRLETFVKCHRPAIRRGNRSNAYERIDHEMRATACRSCNVEILNVNNIVISLLTFASKFQ